MATPKRRAKQEQRGNTAEPGILARTRLKKAGGSLIMTVPASARNLLNLTEGQEMTVRVEGKSVIAEPVPLLELTQRRFRRPKYTIEQLVEGMDLDAEIAREERGWIDAPPAGRETW